MSPTPTLASVLSLQQGPNATRALLGLHENGGRRHGISRRRRLIYPRGAVTGPILERMMVNPAQALPHENLTAAHLDESTRSPGNVHIKSNVILSVYALQTMQFPSDRNKTNHIVIHMANGLGHGVPLPFRSDLSYYHADPIHRPHSSHPMHHQQFLDAIRVEAQSTRFAARLREK
jgi:hypothetical protein